MVRYGVDRDITSLPKVKTDVMRVLDEMGKIPAGYKRLKSGAPSADKRNLGKINHPLVAALATRSEAEHFRTDYITKIFDLAQFDERVRPMVNVAIARTGRMSIGNPPLQQYPAEMRRMMRFDDKVTSMDWSSIEPVFFANAAGATGLIEHFEAGGDLYMPIAEAAKCDRTTAKVVLLAQLYGQGAKSLAGRLGIDDEEAYQLVAQVRGAMPEITKASDAMKRVADRFGQIQTMSGRIVPQDPDPKTGNRAFMGYQGVNHYVQGSCYDLLAESMLAMHRAGLGDELHMAVHDELIVSTEVADEVAHIMETPPADFIEAAGRTPKLRVGRADLGHHWLAK